MRHVLKFALPMLSCLILGCNSVQKNTTEPPICFGPSEAAIGYVYLHGMDSLSPSEQEISNRDKLRRISERLRIRIAVPRAQAKCPQNSEMLCWGWSFNDLETTEIRTEVLTAAKTCGIKGVNLIGFSNGGHAVNALFKSCLIDGDPKLVSIGASRASGKFSSVRDLAKCGTLQILIGKKDQYNYDPERTFLKEIKARNGNIKWTESEGAHEVPEQSLLEVLNH